MRSAGLHTALLAMLFALSPAPARQPDAPANTPPGPRTVAEASGYRQTATYAEVGEFLAEVRRLSPLVRLSSIGTSVEGREIPLALVCDPPVATPAEARASGKLVVVLLGGIHSGECDGKEALLALARDIALAEPADDLRRLLDDLALAFIPIYSPDSNERTAPTNRPGQVGPEEMGVRENAQGLDLNRDFVKLEAPETRALVRFITDSDAAILIDTHTTNGSYHRYVLTYGGAKNPAADPRLLDYSRRMLAQIGRRVLDRHGMDTFWYGDFAAGHTRWEDYPDLPRYGMPYMALRNRLPILTESYSYAPYRERVLAQHAFVLESLRFAAENSREVRELLADAEKRAQEPSPIAIRSRITAFEEPAIAKGWVEVMPEGGGREGGGRAVRTDEPRDYEVEHFANFVPELSVERPHAYLVPPGFDSTVQNLQRHGVKVEELREDIELDVEVYRIDSLSLAAREFQGHRLATAAATARPERLFVRAGTHIVRTDQPLGTLAAYLLEPAAADGLVAWNFFDEALEAVGGDYPVARLPVDDQPLTTIPAAPLPEDLAEPRPVTFEDVFHSRVNFNGSPVGGLTWLDDEHYLQSKDGRPRRVHAPTGRSEPFHDPGVMADALAALPAIGRSAARGLARSLRTMDEARTASLFNHENDLYYCRLDGSLAVRLTSTPEAEELAMLSPDGAMVAFVRENDLWVVDVPTQTERRLTVGGHDLLRRGKHDWVYFEELYNRNWRAFWWSPDSTRIAFLEIDSRPVTTFTMVDALPDPPDVELQPFPKPGGANPRASLYIVTAAGGTPRRVDLSAYDPAGSLITGVGWFPDHAPRERVFCFVADRTQTWIDMLAIPAAAPTPSRLFRESTGTWVSSPTPTFLDDGSFVILSERSGYQHIYRYCAQGRPIPPENPGERDGRAQAGGESDAITSGPWEVRSIRRIVGDADGDWVYFSGTLDNPLGANLYRIRVDGSGLQRLTSGAGSHSADVGPGGRYFISTSSSLHSPPRVALFSARTGEIVRTIDSNPVRALCEYRRGKTSPVWVPTPDGFSLQATVLTPPDFDPAATYPVWLLTYAGPQSPTVGDSWGRGRAWDHALAEEGFIVFRCDPRSASGRGAIHAWTAYRRLGVQEIKDLEDAVRWLAEHPWIDAARIGISGHSYGGYMAAYALTHSTLFAAGIAGAPVTDWRDYDTIYTERYMLTPHENPDGYDASSVTKAAANLHGRLLLLHGMMDDNVHVQHTIRLARELQAADKQFEIMLYPEARHGLGGRHYQRLQAEFILRTLGGPRPAPAAPPAPAPAPAPSLGG